MAHDWGGIIDYEKAHDRPSLGVIVHTYVFLTALMPDDNVFVQDPRGIEGLIMMY